MNRKFVEIGVCLSVALTAGCAPAADLPGDALLGDRFSTGTLGRAPSKALQGLNAEVGATPWKVQGAVALRPDSTATISTDDLAGGTAWLALPAPDKTAPIQPLKVQADINPTGTGWVGLALGGDLSQFFHEAALFVAIRPDGNYETFANGFKSKLASSKIPNFAQGTAVHTEIQYDQTANTVSISLNGSMVVDNSKLEQFGYRPSITSAGFRFHPSSHGLMTANAPSVDNFAVSGTAPPLYLPPALIPTNIQQFFIPPDTASTVQWTVKSTPPVPEIAYKLTDYGGKQIAEGKAVVSADGATEVPLKLAAGYYEISFQGAQQPYGITVLPAYQGKADPFFDMDAALSWLELRPDIREGFVAIMARSGIGMARERLSWGDVNSQPTTLNLKGNRNYEALREEYLKNQMSVLEILAGAPGWTGPTSTNPFPSKLPEVETSVQTLSAKMASYWGGIEVWNEPDYIRNGLPADQYVPLVKTVNYTFHKNNITTPIGGGVFAFYNRAYLDQCLRNGLLDHADFVSFHNYSQAPAVEGMVRDYRNSLKSSSDPSVPLWLTECGWPWQSGPERAPLAQDAMSALEISMKAVEARAVGVARYFPFCLPYYVEPGKNFSMMGHEGTPERSMAAYAQVIKALANTRYVGDLKVSDPAIQRARVFSGNGKNVVVLYTGKTQADAMVKIGITPTRMEGADGRTLTSATAGSIPIPDGMTYCWIENAVLKSALVSDTPAAQLYALAQQKPKPHASPSPLVLQYLIDGDKVAYTSGGYRVSPGTAAHLPLTVRIHNLSAEVKSVTLNAKLDGGKTAIATSPNTSVPANGSADVSMQTDMSMALSSGEPAIVTVSASDGSTTAISPLALSFAMDREIADYLKTFPASNKVDVSDVKQWHSNLSGNGKNEFALTPDAHILLKATFGPGSSWFFPKFWMPPNVDTSQSIGVLIRARSTSPGNCFLMLDEHDGGGIYTTAPNFMPADGQWHTRLLHFEDLSPLVSAPPDPNGKLDADQIARVQVGIVPTKDTANIEISDLYLVEK